MKKSFVIAVSAVTILALVPGVSAGGKKGKKQREKGSVAGAARHPDGCYSGVHRRLQAFLGEGADGLVGYDFDVKKATWNKPFVLKLTDGLGTVDLDITYYLGERTTVEDFVNQGDPAVPPTVGFETRTEGGEVGIVPKGAVYAIVCIYESEGGVGGAASFNYVAGKGVKRPKK